MAEESKTVSTNSTVAVPSETDRINNINNMYDANLASNKANIESAYNQNVSNIEADNAKIASNYGNQKSQLAGQYEINRRNNNIQAINNGINTGAGSQLNLSLSNAYQTNLASLNKSQTEAETEGQRKLTDVKNQYNIDINQAIADSDLSKAQALADAYDTIANERRADANTRAAYGDFSGYNDLYGEDVASQMQTAWNYQNPLLAYNMGRLTVDQYYSLTGSYPPGYSIPSYGGDYYGSTTTGKDDTDDTDGDNTRTYYGTQTVNGKVQITPYKYSVDDNYNTQAHMTTGAVNYASSEASRMAAVANQPVYRK